MTSASLIDHKGGILTEFVSLSLHSSEKLQQGNRDYVHILLMTVSLQESCKLNCYTVLNMLLCQLFGACASKK